jgi:hypothetical protein
MEDLYMDNLDIYDTLNADTEQGTSFLDYRIQYAKARGNNHDLLAESSSPGLGSIIEAIDGSDSISKYKSATQQSLTANQTAFDTLLTQYTTAYNSYVSSTYMTKVNTGVKPSVTDTSNNIVVQANLQALNSQLLALATTISREINSLRATDGTLRKNIQDQETSLFRYINELNEQQGILNNVKTSFDSDSVDGRIETTELTFDSYYLQYIVYFFISVTLIVFIFNITINPNADIMRSVFLLVALLAVYIISRWVNK